MKKILDKAGLLLMALGTAAIVVCFLIVLFITGFNISIYWIAVLPVILLFVITLKDRLLGGLLTTVVSALLLAPVSISLTSSEVTPSSFILFAIIICFFLGGACILTSLAMRAPYKGNAKA
ncbi:MAG: hypothetical protein A2Y90_04905 [Chloroflexi bacterium RBG_13_52_12]|nr:MAG: hypothetical protein A2Y90_04905 [Chloroflexi bacterium RBG_13_52_12]